jgi:hypothetical protein
MTKTSKSITFGPLDYRAPAHIPKDSLPDCLPTVQILFEDIWFSGERGVSWEQLENHYMVDIDTLKRYLTLPYEKGRALLQINVLDAMVGEAVDKKNVVMLKWLSANWLGMSEKTVAQPPQAPVDEQDVNDKLTALIEKHAKPAAGTVSATVPIIVETVH